MDLTKFKVDAKNWFRDSIKKYLDHAKKTYFKSVELDEINRLNFKNERDELVAKVPAKRVSFVSGRAYQGCIEYEDHFEVFGWVDGGTLKKGESKYVVTNMNNFCSNYKEYRMGVWEIMDFYAVVAGLHTGDSEKVVPAGVSLVSIGYNGELHMLIYSPSGVTSKFDESHAHVYFRIRMKKKK
jgi:hypothetical protein